MWRLKTVRSVSWDGVETYDGWNGWGLEGGPIETDHRGYPLERVARVQRKEAAWSLGLGWNRGIRWMAGCGEVRINGPTRISAGANSDGYEKKRKQRQVLSDLEPLNNGAHTSPCAVCVKQPQKIK